MFMVKNRMLVEFWWLKMQKKVNFHCSPSFSQPEASLLKRSGSGQERWQSRCPMRRWKFQGVKGSCASWFCDGKPWCIFLASTAP